ncbi:hypothetical protein TESG_07084 [Trichophyton tonsurans CBS 112818]|uniref:peptidylprolyl isomerase n=1 Tax=Trichophyton tonsurans (strain CBS 112818) TaxID=647933 RepID=F2S846_TRIT1|nr:hypothetical protein TESG_07084 [Trichophyton tonsurans CBS 112818]
MGVKKYAFERGSGDFPTKDDLVKVKFSCFLYDDTNQKDCYKGDRVVMPTELEFCIEDGQTTKGLNEGVSRMKLGESCALIVPSKDAYGERY